jgi:hypothetical protein
MLGDAEQKPTEIAKRVRISARSVRRRLEKILASNSAFMIPLVDLSRIEGVPCHLLVECHKTMKPEIDEKISLKLTELVFKSTASRSYSIFGLNCANLTEGQEISRWIQSLAGVRSVRLNIVQRVDHIFDWLERKIQESISTPKL